MNNVDLNKANPEALQRIEDAKYAKKVTKGFEKALKECEVEIAKMIATMASFGDDNTNITTELIRFLAILNVSVTQRYLDKQAHRDVFLKSVADSTASLNELMKDSAKVKSEQLQEHVAKYEAEQDKKELEEENKPKIIIP